MLGDEPITRAYDLNAQYWISVIRKGIDPYQTQITDPALLDAIGRVADLDVLDAGCGEGYLSRRLAESGAASVTGVDTCRAFIEAATQMSTPRCRFLHADVADIPLADDTVDLVVANRLPHGLSEAGARYHEFARVLRPHGRMILVGQHPCFYRSRSERTTAIPVEDYFTGRIVEQHFDVASQISPAASVQKLYSLEQYISMITAAGFVITGIREPHPSTEQLQEDPQWRTRFQRPLFLLIETRLD
ncbi:putative methyltransferase [Nocardia nova SH22a]|uniref:Putative methyltransferase n=1 Tax=Nocardia nova SH22a TaxID=1415166 RepID=W5TR61_9NOCA|nr:class I SAM-dependent methyltransferase [Nocardia nova]AHH21649.1 putative methyltransferase [Nocardia nova SH22a]